MQRATIGQEEIGRNYHGDHVWIQENLKLLHPNRNGARRDFEGLEKRLHRRGQGLTEAYNQGIDEGFAQGAYRWTTDIEKEIKEFNEFQKHYIAFNYVENPNSKTTPLRVTKDMARPGVNGLSLNHCMSAGGRTLNNMSDTLYHIRTSEKLAIGDVSKMFWRFKTPPKTWSLNRFFHKRGGLGSQDDWEEASCCTADFGATGAPSLANCGMDQCVIDHISSDDPQLAEEISKKRYMDDVFLVDRWEANIHPKIEKTERGLAKGGLTIKEWLVSGEGSPESGTS